MRIVEHYRHNTDGKGTVPVYKDVRGPTGDRYHQWRWALGARLKARFGIGEKPEDRRKLRNARKQERRA